ncbi:hypothetical protein SEA_ORANGE_48 [Mycobacterium phage Orange]|nr:hypothetical protein SEA_ORANGE_48 [Mycobacterium phage Orange]
MARRATSVTTVNGWGLFIGEPMLDADEGTLIIQFEDGTWRTFNWDYVIDYYYLSEEETEEQIKELSKNYD